MRDCVLDTHILVELIANYDPTNQILPLDKSNVISRSQAKEINSVIELEGSGALIATSSISLIEILNQFNIISKDESRFSIYKFFSFIQQPPSWFIVEDMTQETSFYLSKVPKTDRAGNNIELADAIHVATAIQRGPDTKLLTNDGRLNKMALTELKITILSNA